MKTRSTSTDKHQASSRTPAVCTVVARRDLQQQRRQRALGVLGVEQQVGNLVTTKTNESPCETEFNCITIDGSPCWEYGQTNRCSYLDLNVFVAELLLLQARTSDPTEWSAAKANEYHGEGAFLANGQHVLGLRDHERVLHNLRARGKGKNTTQEWKMRG